MFAARKHVAAVTAAAFAVAFLAIPALHLAHHDRPHDHDRGAIRYHEHPHPHPHSKPATSDHGRSTFAHFSAAIAEDVDPLSIPEHVERVECREATPQSRRVASAEHAPLVARGPPA